MTDDSYIKAMQRIRDVTHARGCGYGNECWLPNGDIIIVTQLGDTIEVSVNRGDDEFPLTMSRETAAMIHYYLGLALGLGAKRGP